MTRDKNSGLYGCVVFTTWPSLGSLVDSAPFSPKHVHPENFRGRSWLGCGLRVSRLEVGVKYIESFCGRVALELYKGVSHEKLSASPVVGCWFLLLLLL